MEMMQRFSQVSANASALNAPVTMRTRSEVLDSYGQRSRFETQGDPLGSDGLPMSRGAANDDPDADPAIDANDDLDADERREDAKLANSLFMPRGTHSAVNKLTEELLGDQLDGSGTAIIIDLAQGVYYVCGSLIDKDPILRFLD